MTLRAILAILVLVCLAALGGCPAGDDSGDTEEPAKTKVTKRTVPRQAGKAKSGLTPGEDDDSFSWHVDQSAVDAWMLVETAYFVIKDKWQQSTQLMNSDDPAEVQRGNEMRDAVSQEIDQNIFFVNDEVERLFKEAIDNEPDNPLNLATYAFYLKARKRMADGIPVDTEGEALDLMDQAIEMWPDHALFYVLKSYILLEPQICHDWFRASPQEETVLAMRIPDVIKLLDKASENAPDNHFIDYYKALSLANYGDVNISAQSLISTYESSSEQFMHVFRNRGIRVYGAVNSVEQTDTGLKIVLQANPDEEGDTLIHCYFRDGYQDSDVSLEQGQGALIVGICNVVDDELVLKDCYFETALENKERYLMQDEILAAIRAGNQKEWGGFFYPPPLEANELYYQKAVLSAENTKPVYIDHWNLFGKYEMIAVDTMITRLTSYMSWPEDKEDIGAIMYMLYQLGRTIPYDTSFFGLQLKVLQPFANDAEPGSQEAMDLAAAIRYLNDQYRTVANQFFDAGMISDITKVDVRGVHEVERDSSHRNKLKKLLQGHQAAYLKRAGEILGLEFPLDKDPDKW